MSDENDSQFPITEGKVILSHNCRPVQSPSDKYNWFSVAVAT